MTIVKEFSDFGKFVKISDIFSEIGYVCDKIPHRKQPGCRKRGCFWQNRMDEIMIISLLDEPFPPGKRLYQ